jgi:predicted dehydrogenase
VRLLVVGGGSAGERHVRCFLKARPKLEVELCEPRRARAVELVARYPLLTAHPDLARVDLARFDAAVVATPADLHARQARRLLAAGCHVLVEKPLGVSRQALGELRALARRGRLQVAVGFNYRFYPDLERLAALVRAGRVGRPLAARVTLAYNYPLYRRDWRRNYFARPETGGGAVVDIASHAVAWLSGALGPITEVGCLAGRLGLRGVAVEDTALLTLRLRSGALAEVWASAWQPRRRTEFEVLGTGGQLRYRTLFETGRTELAYNPGDRPGAGFYRGCRPWRVLAGRRFDPDEPFVLQARNFLAAVAGRGAVRTGLDAAGHVDQVCRAARRSARTGRRVTLR